MNNQAAPDILIAADVGNSSISIGFYSESSILSVMKIPTHPLLQEGDYADVISSYMVDNSIEKENIRCIISSVVVSHTSVIAGALRSLAGGAENKVRILNASMELGIRLATREPGEMGSDRLAAAAGAYALFHRPLAVVDFGTATTITVVDADGKCCCGAIMAGLGLMNSALETGTSRLRAVPLVPPVSALGKTTRENILAGLFFGSAGAVEFIVEAMEREMGYGLYLLVTGGHGQAMSPFLTRKHEVIPFLVLEGLRTIDGYNR